MKKLITVLVSLALSAVAVYFVTGFIRNTYSEGITTYNESINAEVEARREQLLETSVFRNGVVVSDISIGGMTYKEALQALKPVEYSLIKDVGFTLHYDDKQTFLGMFYFDVSYNTKQILGEAIMLATEGEPEYIQQQIDEIASEGRYYTVECTVSPKLPLINYKINSIADTLYVAPVNAYYMAKPEGVEAGVGIDNRFTFYEGKQGLAACPEEAIEEITRRAAEADYGDVTLKVEPIDPKITVEYLRENVVMRSYYESSYASGSYSAPNRVHNIIKACGLVNGTCVYPYNPNNPDDSRHIFSTNDCLGYRTLEDGWLMAPGFVDGGTRSEDSPGGGVCHVSSTMYNAVIKADLRIVYRINHSSHVGYVPWGLDATIDSGRIDFKWSNNTGSYIYVFMYVNTSKKVVCCEIWGEPFPDEFDYIDFYSEFIEEIEPGETEYIEKSELEKPYWYIYNSAKTGYRYQSFKQYYKDGAPVGDPVKVAFSEYKMHPIRICVWPGFNPDTDELLPEYKTSRPKD